MQEDIRGRAQVEFFNLMRGERWIFGHPPNTSFAIGADGVVTYTYNVMLDMWGRYSIISVMALAVVLIRRIMNAKHFKITLPFLLPLAIYGSVESLFFPNYWDPLIFLVLFERKPLSPTSRAALLESSHGSSSPRESL